MKRSFRFGYILHNIVNDCECMIFGVEKLNVVITASDNGEPLVEVVNVSVISFDIHDARIFIKCCLQ